MQGMELVARAIRSGIFNDLGSGSNVDLCIITKGKVGPVMQPLGFAAVLLLLCRVRQRRACRHMPLTLQPVREHGI